MADVMAKQLTQRVYARVGVSLAVTIIAHQLAIVTLMATNASNDIVPNCAIS